ncbi:hypothetical protein COT72_04250 [archaeon CG10_big_fil_rev_8_21_14_0_10_43_11]|nr:MAG: hypothetical protein COT72_04250 [archaeon CG10_big_fil_rev_8_21_14_0_10_43_11]
MFELELDRVVHGVLENASKRVLIQLPDGLKPQAAQIADVIEEKTGATVLIWLSSCYGACDIPLGLNTIAVDHFIQWGHNKFNKRKEGW